MGESGVREPLNNDTSSANPHSVIMIKKVGTEKNSSIFTCRREELERKYTDNDLKDNQIKRYTDA